MHCCTRRLTDPKIYNPSTDPSVSQATENICTQVMFLINAFINANLVGIV